MSEVERKLHFIGDAPLLKISALTGKGVHRLRPVLQEAITQYHRRVPTKDVNRVLADAQQRQAAAGGAKVLFAVQGASDPPTFGIDFSRPANRSTRRCGSAPSSRNPRTEPKPMKPIVRTIHCSLSFPLMIGSPSAHAAHPTTATNRISGAWTIAVKSPRCRTSTTAATTPMR